MVDAQTKPRKKRKVSIPTVIALLLLLALVLLQRDRLANAARVKGVLDAHAPDPAIIQQVVTNAARPDRVLWKLWNSGKIPHRWEAISYLNHHGRDNARLLERAGGIIDQAAWDRDLTVRFIGMNLARILHRPGWLDAARFTLRDPDYDIRLEALHVIRRARATNALPAIAGCLSDENHEIASLAAGLIRNYTGQPFPGANLIAEVSDWWQAHRQEFPPLPPVQIPELPPGPDYSHLMLESRDRKPIPIESFRGRPVLISFFATWDAPTLLQMPDLMRLQSALGDRIKILGVPLDTLGGARKQHGQPFDPEAARRHVLRLTALRRLNYEIAFDPDGSAMLQLEGAEVPAHILLGPDLRLVRRFTGRRDFYSLRRIVSELLLQ